jgi:UDP-glucose 4-epimerase
MANLPSRLTHAAVKGIEPQLSGRGGNAVAGDFGDMCYVKDCAQGIQKVHMAATLPHRIYNVGSGKATANGTLVDAVNKAVPGASIKLPEGSSGRSSADSYCDLTQIRADAGYEPEYDVYKGVADYAAWLRSNPQ